MDTETRKEVHETLERNKSSDGWSFHERDIWNVGRR